MKLLIRVLQLSVEIKIAPVARSCLHLRTYPEMSDMVKGLILQKNITIGEK